MITDSDMDPGGQKLMVSEHLLSLVLGLMVTSPWIHTGIPLDILSYYHQVRKAHRTTVYCLLLIGLVLYPVFTFQIP